MTRTLFIVFAAMIISSLPAKAKILTDSLFIVTYTTGPSWDQSKKPDEQPFFKEHSGRLSQLRKDKVIRFGARYADKGIIVIAAPDLTSAKEIISADPAVVNKLFVVDIQKLSIFYEGCLERPK